MPTGYKLPLTAAACALRAGKLGLAAADAAPAPAPPEADATASASLSRADAATTTLVEAEDIVFQMHSEVKTCCNLMAVVSSAVCDEKWRISGRHWPRTVSAFAILVRISHIGARRWLMYGGASQCHYTCLIYPHRLYRCIRCRLLFWGVGVALCEVEPAISSWRIEQFFAFVAPVIYHVCYFSSKVFVMWREGHSASRASLLPHLLSRVFGDACVRTSRRSHYHLPAIVQHGVPSAAVPGVSTRELRGCKCCTAAAGWPSAVWLM